MPQPANPPHPQPSTTQGTALRTAFCLGSVWLICAIAAPRSAPVFAADPPQPATPAADSTSTNPDAVCAACHQAIYASYERTNMAQGSGAAVDGILQGGFTHSASGIEYKIFLRNGHAWMSYTRSASSGEPASSATPPAPLTGEQQLLDFIGSGHRGRTYLYQQDGFWFEAPINYYGKKALWDMAPAYGSVRFMPDALPVDPNCLHCHATAVQPSLPEARNRFAAAPFLQPGIGCSACHGDPTAHLAQVKAQHSDPHGNQPAQATILNPATLSPVRRDSICLQCHLEGEAAIYRAGSSLASFKPGDDLFDHVLYFVRAANNTGTGRATSQYEALLHSACKIASGDKLTCTTCHDPHSSPAPQERVAWFRAKCLACHTGPAMATQHHPEQQDCAVCHMPTRNTTDISHEQQTDHNIQARPATSTLSLTSLPPSQSDEDLIPVGPMPPPDRELGLAYAQRALHGDRAAAERALTLLRKAEQAQSNTQSNTQPNTQANANDVPLHLNLGLLDQLSGDTQAARSEYTQALAADPYQVTALGNLAILDAASGQTTEAMKLLQKSVAGDPSQTAAALNLAFIECRLGDTRSASDTLATLARFNPDDPALRAFLTTGAYAGQHCNLHPEHPADTPP